MNDSKKSAALRQGVLVFVVLAVLTALEYWAAVSTGIIALLFLLLLLKAALVVVYYMHVSRVFSPDAGGH